MRKTNGYFYRVNDILERKSGVSRTFSRKNREKYEHKKMNGKVGSI